MNGLFLIFNKIDLLMSNTHVMLKANNGFFDFYFGLLTDMLGETFGLIVGWYLIILAVLFIAGVIWGLFKQSDIGQVIIFFVRIAVILIVIGLIIFGVVSWFSHRQANPSAFFVR